MAIQLTSNASSTRPVVRAIRRRGGPSLQPPWWSVPYPSSLVSQSPCQCWGIRAGMSIAGRWGTSRYGVSFGATDVEMVDL